MAIMFMIYLWYSQTTAEDTTILNLLPKQGNKQPSGRQCSQQPTN
jgi:hypothetical protein